MPTHPAAVLPLKLWRPRRFDGVALAVGSTAPDLAYPLDGSGLPVWPLSHQWHGLILWCLPVTLAATWLIRRAAPVLADHLPPCGPFALRDYGSVGRGSHRWTVTVLSALLAAASHLVLDRAEALSPTAEYAMHALGLAGLLAALLAVGRRRLLRQWHGEPPPVHPRPALFWTIAAAVTLPMAAATLLLPAALLLHTTAVRLLCALAAGLLIAALATGRFHDNIDDSLPGRTPRPPA